MTVTSIPCRACQIMPWLFALYAAANLLHFMHNAGYVAQYPNLPAWWTRADVPIAHHSVAMNLTIWGEVAAAAVLLIDVASVATWHIRLNTRTAA